MQIGMVGLGRMGANMTRRLMKAGHECVVFSAHATSRQALAKEGATAADSLEELVKALKEKPRAVWLMLPAGQATEETVEHLGGLLELDDIIIDGGNTFYKDDIRRAKKLAGKRIRYVDCGTSGGVWGLERGYCLMIGGPKDAVERLDPVFSALAPGLGDIPRTPGRERGDPRAERGYIHAGPSGAGHFVKMVHNGIEYGLMQAYAEGFDILRNKDSSDLPEDERFVLNMPDIAEVWRRGSVIVILAARPRRRSARGKIPELNDFSGFVQDSGEGPVDYRGCHRGSRSGGSVILSALRPIPLPAEAYLRRKDPLRHAFRLRRPHRGCRTYRPGTEVRTLAAGAFEGRRVAQ